MNAINNNGANPATRNAVDFDAFAFNMFLSKTFQDLLKKPELDDDASAPSSAAVGEINKTIASAMAQSISGFGL